MLNLVSSAGAQAALRGYRLQALYTLYRLLSSDGRAVFQPEGREDLDVLGASGELLEVVQVKAYEASLTLSAFNLGKPESFFRRVLARVRVNPNGIERIVSFGPFGSQMTRAWEGVGNERSETVKLFENNGYSEDEANTIISRVRLEVVDSSIVEAAVLEKLQSSLAGVDPSAAFDLLHAWLFVSCETKQQISEAALRERILAVGRFVNERAAHQDEWFRSIVPLSDNSGPTDQASLRAEFYSGISARYGHILANVDVHRPTPLKAIDEAFVTRRLVIVHGASGQGKTALAYRYLHDFIPEAWRFAIRLVESRSHALNIARAVLGHLAAIGGRAYVYIDVAPGENSWLELVRGLAEYPFVRILVTIREEDWRRTISPADLLPARDIELNFGETEAQAVYAQLVADNAPAHVLGFDDAWARFGGRGPLLEFAYFVMQNETLFTRLSGQVQRLQEEVRNGTLQKSELELLRRAAVAAAYSARLDLRLVVADLALNDPLRTLSLFEREFLVRVASDQRFVEGLHPIRSEMLARLLVDETFTPWAAVATRCLPAIAEGDLESFLLHAFSRHPDEIEVLRRAITILSPRTWTGVAGTLRSLVWLGAKRYLQQNDAVVRDAHSQFGSAWPFILMPDIGNVNAVTPGLVEPMFAHVEWIAPEKRLAFAELRERLSPIAALDDAKYWLTALAASPELPSDGPDWLAVAEVAFWLGHLGVKAGLADALPAAILAQSSHALSLDVAADIAYGFSFLHTDALKEALALVRPTLLARLQKETSSPVIEDDGSLIRAHFILDWNTAFGRGHATPSDPHPNIVHREAMRRVSLLRRIVPDRDTYGCQGYGHKLGLVPVEGDDSTKGIAARLLPPRWPLRPNLAFIRLGEYQFRVDHWDTYARTIDAKRQLNIAALKSLIEALCVYFKDANHRDIFGIQLVADDWTRTAAAIHEPLSFPRDAVDEWGEVSDAPEASESAYNKVVSEIAPALEHHAQFRKSYTDFISPLSNFHRQAADAIAVQPTVARATTPAQKAIVRSTMEAHGIAPNPGSLPLHNLFSAWQHLRAFQSQFRERFGQYFAHDYLAELDEQEASVIRRAFSIWYQFSYHAERTTALAHLDAERRLDAALSDVTRRLRGRLKKLEKSSVFVSIRTERIDWAQKPALWLTIDVSDPRFIFDAFVLVYKAIAKLISEVLQDELSRYAVWYEWGTVHLIPLVDGRLLQKAGWRLNAPLMVGATKAGEPIPWWHVILQPLSDEIFESLGLELPAWPSLEVVDRLVTTVSEVTILVGSINAVSSLPEPTGVGGDVISEYGAARSAELSGRVNEMIRAMGSFASLVSGEADAARGENEMSPLLTAIELTLPDLYGQLLPTRIRESEDAISSAEMKSWEEQLVSGASVLQNVRLHWVGYLAS